MDAQYNIYFAGEVLDEQDLTLVRTRLATLFKADDATLDKLFSGKAQLIKRNCDKTTALKYKKAMERAGAKPVIKAAAPRNIETDSASTPAATSAEKIAALAAAPDENAYRSDRNSPDPVAEKPPATKSAGVDLAPAGADVLRPEERSETTTADIDTSQLVVDQTAARLSDEPPSPPPAPDTSHLTMGQVGDTLPTLAQGVAPSVPDTTALSLTPAGSDFSDCAPPQPEPPELDLSTMDLAPAGADVLETQYRKPPSSTTPNTDHINLED